MYIRLSTCPPPPPKKMKWKLWYIFFGQYRGASFTSFFKTYNLTKYYCILCPFIFIDKIVITSTVFKLHFSAMRATFVIFINHVKLRMVIIQLLGSPSLVCSSPLSLCFHCRSSFDRSKNSPQKVNNLGTKIIIIEYTLERCTSSKLSIEWSSRLCNFFAILTTF